MIHSQQIRSKVSRINRRESLRCPLEVNRDAAGFRITRDQESKDVSPRLTGREMMAWLSGFEEGMDYRYVSGE